MRTTYQTRKDQRVRKDEVADCQDHELLPLSDNNGTNKESVQTKDSSSSASSNCCLTMCNWILGFKDDQMEGGHEKEMEKHIEQLSTLEQSTLQKIILFINLVLIISLSIVLFIVMSINPFTDEQLDVFKSIAFNKTHLIQA